MSTDFVGGKRGLRWLAPLLFATWASCTRSEGEPRELAGAVRSAASSTSMLNFARMAHQAVPLDADRVLVCGGLVDLQSSPRYLDSCEIYSVPANAWSPTAWPALPEGRHLFTLTRLDAEHVVAVGGMTPGAEPNSLLAISSAVVGTANGWSAPELIHARWGHATSLLPDGRVFVVGGGNLDGLVPEVELRPATTDAAVWSTVGSYSVSEPSATVLQPGPVAAGQTMEVMIVGGLDAQSSAQTGVRLFSLAAGAPAANRIWRDLSSLPTGRYRHTATLLDNGDVLVVGGLSDAGPLASAYRYDRREEKWEPAGTPLARYEHSAARIGRFVVVAGGVVESAASDTVEAYDPERDPVLHPDTVPAGTNPWVSLKALGKARQDTSMTALSDGASALVVAGTDGRVESQTAEILRVGVPAATCTDDASCLSGFCADGVCCDRACQGSCEACNRAGQVGTCVAVSGPSPAAHPPCQDGSVCSAGECTSDCRQGAACGPDQSCSSSGSCVTVHMPGEACVTNADCLSGLVCADGVCCQTSCAGACESCAEPGHEGTCVPVSGQPRTGHPACPSDSCGPRCDGSSGSCRAPAECHTGCADDAECATDRFCSAGACLPKGDAGSQCDEARQCAASLTCVDAVCCREPSCGEGASCAFEPYAGTCKKALGVACASSFECASDRCVTVCCVEGACPGDCTTTTDCSAGYVCEAGRCKQAPPPPSPHCSSDGTALVEPGGSVVSCAPYKCASALGSCATSCQHSSDCASPNLCDPDHVCREPSRPASPEGCSIHQAVPAGHGRGAVWLVAALGALMTARRARRTQR